MHRRQGVAVVCVSLMVVLTSTIFVVIWRKTSGDDNDPITPAKIQTIHISPTALLQIKDSQIDINFRKFATNDTNFNSFASLAYGVNNSQILVSDTFARSGHVIFRWDDGSNMTLTDIPSTDPSMSCFNILWKMANGSQETPRDCFDLKHNLWFGGFEEAFQFWPINKNKISSSPFVTGDGYKPNNIGDVIEGLFVSSAGVGIYIDENSSMYLSINESNSEMLCLSGKTGQETPFFNTHEEPVLTYDICQASDIVDVWKGMTKFHIPRPTGTPSPDVLRHPIWSTWARYKAYINQTTVLQFAREIKSRSFGISQLELDDNWTPKYGDYTFETTKFPNATAMVSKLTDLGIPITVWLHPFFNIDSKTFGKLTNEKLLIKESQFSNKTALTSWWRGDRAGILDITNPDAVLWFLNMTKRLQADFNITSFKFDAGEVNLLPKKYKVTNDMASPNDFSHLFARMAFESDKTGRRQEIRTSFRNQDLPILVRMIDRDSSWGHEKGLKTLIPCALTMGLMGYPFVLPDMVGGNAYNSSDLDKTVLPHPELFIRWLQATALMPSIQFSIPPWFYNDTIVSISKKFTSLHESFAEKIIALAKHAVAKGEPILRPIWWLAPEDDVALQIESQFLLGNDVLVAPVLEKGATSRDIYLPPGRWREDAHETYTVYSGPMWLKDFPAGLDILPYFTKNYL